MGFWDVVYIILVAVGAGIWCWYTLNFLYQVPKQLKRIADSESVTFVNVTKNVKHCGGKYNR